MKSTHDAIYAGCNFAKSYDAKDNNCVLSYHTSSDLQEQALAMMETEWHATIRLICSDETLYKSLYLHKINAIAFTSSDGRVWVFKRERHPREEFNKWNRQVLCIHLKDIQQFQHLQLQPFHSQRDFSEFYCYCSTILLFVLTAMTCLWLNQ